MHSGEYDLTGAGGKNWAPVCSTPTVRVGEREREEANEGERERERNESDFISHRRMR